ncbi:MAG: Lrp/AsnC family transcriptional regulator, partial [Ralstonia sp.]
TPGVMDIRSNIVLRTIKDREGGLALLMDARGVRPLEGGAGKRGKAG